MPAVDPNELVAQLVVLTKMDPDEVRDFLSASSDDQLLMVQTYRTLDWAQSPDVLAKVIAICTVLGTIAGAVSGLAGAGTAVAALKTI